MQECFQVHGFVLCAHGSQLAPCRLYNHISVNVLILSVHIRCCHMPSACAGHATLTQPCAVPVAAEVAAAAAALGKPAKKTQAETAETQHHSSTVLKSADMNFAISLMSPLIAQMEQAGAAPQADVECETIAATSSHETSKTKKKRKRQQQQQQQEEGQSGTAAASTSSRQSGAGSTAAWVAVAEGVAGMLAAMRRTGSYRPTEDIPGNHGKYLEHVAQVWECHASISLFWYVIVLATRYSITC